MRYVNQKQYPEIPYITCINPEHPQHERGKTTSIKTSGCGLCSSIMIADRLLVDYEYELEDAIALSYKVGANRGAGTARIYFDAFADRFGLIKKEASTIEELKECLQTGGAAIVHVGGDSEGRIGLFSHVGHYIVAIGVEPDGRIAILDPALEPGRYDEEGRAGKVEVKNGFFSVVSPELLHEDTLTRQPGSYILFWRK
ncbi:MAG: hypothetical protein E7580_07210 [Ruminococcaceae bacterium]|nr:hypothetical protein [Oscillospiraceae bacterium]